MKNLIEMCEGLLDIDDDTLDKDTTTMIDDEVFKKLLKKDRKSKGRCDAFYNPLNVGDWVFFAYGGDYKCGKQNLGKIIAMKNSSYGTVKFVYHYNTEPVEKLIYGIRYSDMIKVNNIEELLKLM